MSKVSYSFGMTLPGAEPYSSIRFDFSHESDVVKGESVDKAMNRVKKFVMEKADEEYDRIKEAIEDVEWSLIISFALVVAVVYVSLRRFRETMIVATALPLSVIGTFIVMQILGFNIDILSLLAITLSIGLFRRLWPIPHTPLRSPPGLPSGRGVGRGVRGVRLVADFLVVRHERSVSG